RLLRNLLRLHTSQRRPLARGLLLKLPDEVHLALAELLPAGRGLHLAKLESAPGVLGLPDLLEEVCPAPVEAGDARLGRAAKQTKRATDHPPGRSAVRATEHTARSCTTRGAL